MSKVFILSFLLFCLIVTSYGRHNNRNNFLNNLEEKCTNLTGDRTYFDKVKQAAKETMTCITTIWIQSNVKSAFSQSMHFGGDGTGAFLSICQNQNNLMNCITSRSNIINVCLTEQEVIQKTTVTHILDEFSKLLCYKDGDLIVEIFKDDGHICIMNNLNEIESCVRKILKTKIDYEIYSKSDKCRDFVKLENCIMPMLNKCEALSPEKVTHRLMKELYKKISCNKQHLVKFNTDDSTKSFISSYNKL